MDATERFRLLEKLFHAARQIPPDEREAFVEQRVPATDGLRAEVRRLLAREAQESLLDRPVASLPDEFATRSSNDVALPTAIGRYRIRGVLGRGGMGIVYEAEQDAPRRIVALKLLSAALASREALRRFRNEVEILGRLHHPGIARIFDAGTFDSGNGPQPYFAMELVRGAPITEHAHRQRLSTRARLELVAGVCDVVQHAHELGVVHRDLKPSNILVDLEGKPQVLDFGIARALHFDIAATTVQTAVGQLLGTLPYMSPEQAAGDSSRLDARSDIYALGIVAYELLCGRRPYALEDRLMPEALRAIQEDEPTPLSAFDRGLRGDVDTIVRKALEKDPARRYQSAAAMSDDIRRFLRDLPIIARPPSRIEQLQRLVRRHRGLAAGIVIGFMLMLVGLVFSVRETIRARGAERDAALRSDEAARSAYRASIAAATAEMQTWDAVAARRRLDAVPLDQRAWEWHRLSALSDGCAALLDVGQPCRAQWLDVEHNSVKALLADGGLITVDATSGAPRASQQLAPLALAVFSGDGAHLLGVTSEAPKLTIRSLPDGAEQVLAELSARPRRVAASEDGRFVAALHGRDTVQVWDRESGQMHTVEGGLYVQDLALPRSGAFVVISSAGGVRAIDRTSGAILLSVIDVGAGAGIDIAPDEKRIAAGGPDKQVHLIDMASGQIVQRMTGHSGTVLAVRWSGDGTKIVSLGNEGALRWWDATSGALLGTKLAPHARSLPPGSRFDEGCFATRDADGKTRIWRDASGGDHAALPHEGYVYSVTFSSGAARVISGGWDGKIRVWDSASGEAIAAIDARASYITALAVSADERFIASGHHRGPGKPSALRLWDADTGQLVRSFPNGMGEVKSLCFSPNGRQLLVARAHAPATVWDVERGTIVGKLDNGGVRVNCAAWSSDGAWLATGDLENAVALWDAGTLTRVSTFSGHAAPVTDCCFSVDGTMLASASEDRTARIWRLDDRAMHAVTVVQGHTDGVLGVAFSPDGKRVATGSRDTTVRLWDPITGDEITRLDGHADYVYRLAFAPNGAQLASASGDRTVRLWDSRPMHEVEQARAARAACAARLAPRLDAWFSATEGASSTVARIRAVPDLNAAERELALQLALQRCAVPEK